MTTALPDAPAAISLADVAGKWKLRSTDEAGGTPVESELTATADTSGWMLLNPGRKPVPVRLQGGKLVGTIEARYATKSGDSVVRRQSEGTRVP